MIIKHVGKSQHRPFVVVQKEDLVSLDDFSSAANVSSVNSLAFAMATVRQ